MGRTSRYLAPLLLCVPLTTGCTSLGDPRPAKAIDLSKPVDTSSIDVTVSANDFKVSIPEAELTQFVMRAAQDYVRRCPVSGASTVEASTTPPFAVEISLGDANPTDLALFSEGWHGFLKTVGGRKDIDYRDIEVSARVTVGGAAGSENERFSFRRYREEFATADIREAVEQVVTRALAKALALQS